MDVTLRWRAALKPSSDSQTILEHLCRKGNFSFPPGSSRSSRKNKVSQTVKEFRVSWSGTLGQTVVLYSTLIGFQTKPTTPPALEIPSKTGTSGFEVQHPALGLARRGVLARLSAAFYISAGDGTFFKTLMRISQHGAVTVTANHTKHHNSDVLAARTVCPLASPASRIKLGAGIEVEAIQLEVGLMYQDDVKVSARS
ncbi:hypothetical protein BDR05DRAFT_953352 [Suillus weaverae]|nr:hypothetical protein BDR05DRAFT_953352 [Suillus weaverae]